jgi:hypothetical protein
VETKMGENHIILFLYIKRIPSLEEQTSQLSQLEGGYDPIFTGSNLKEATTP